MNRFRSILFMFGAVTAVTGAPAEMGEETLSWPTRYGNAPEAMVPFRRMEPYHRYFTEPLPFYGPGREKTPSGRANEYRIGLLSSAPGSADAERGRQMRWAVEMAVEEWNARREPGLPEVLLIIREDNPLWGSAANIMVDFATEDRVIAVIGTVDAAATHVALRAALKTETFIVNTASSDPTVTETNIPWLLRIFPDDRQHGYRLADLVVSEYGCRRIVVFRANDRYGRTGVRVFTDSVRRLGSPVILEMRFTPGEKTFATQVARIATMQPEAIVFWGEPNDVGRAMSALRANHVKARFFGPDRLLDETLLQVAGKAAEGLTVTYPFDAETAGPGWRDFVQRFRGRYDVAPDYFAGYAFDGANLLLESIEASGPNRYRIRDYLVGVRRYEGVMGEARFDGSSNNLAPLHVARVKDGAFVFESESHLAKQ